MATREKTLNLAGLEVKTLVPGGFYQCMTVGGLTDALTGIHIPGPKAEIDDAGKRDIVRLTDIPEPVQIPHFKIIMEMSEGGKVRKEIKADFDRNDEQPIHDLFQMALSTDSLRYVPDEEMEAKYSETWAKRKLEYIWRSPDVKQPRSAAEMFHEAEQEGRFQRHAKDVKARIDAASPTAPVKKPQAPVKPGGTV